MAQQGQAAPVVAPRQVPYARTPGTLNPNNLLDFDDSKDVKYYYKAIEWIAEKYGLESPKLYGYGQRINEKITACGLQNVTNLPVPGVGAGAAPIPTPFIDNYGTITMAQCQAQGAIIMGVQDRRNQNSGILASILKNSLTPEALAIVDLEPEQYTFNGEMEGLCLLKHIFSKAHVDTNATVGSLRNEVSSLNTKVIEMKYDMIAFNQHVLQLEHSLAAHGERVDELMSNLFKAYKRVQDEEFLQFIRTHEFHWNAQPGGIVLTVKTLMTSVDNHYALRVKEGTWKPKYLKTDKERIVALEANIEQMNRRQVKKAPNPNNEGKGKGKDKKGKYDWKKEAPPAGKPHTYVWPDNGKTYYWCPNHKAWTIHRPEECTKSNDTESPVANNTEDEDSDQDGGHPRMMIDPALPAIVRNGGCYGYD
jgi:hypothetical protein